MISRRCRFERCILSATLFASMTALLVPTAARADEPVASEVVRVDGSAAAVANLQFGPDWAVEGKRGDEKVNWNGRDLLFIRGARKAALRPRNVQIVLAEGETLAGSAGELAADALSITSVLAGKVTIPLGVVLGFVIDSDASEAKATSLVAAIRNPRRTRDEVILKNGDVLAGLFKSISAKDIRIEQDGKERVVAREIVAAVALDPNLIDAKPSRDFHAQVKLADGSVFSASGIASAADAIEITAPWPAKIKVKAQDVAEVLFKNGRVVYLSDLQPTRVTATPFLDEPFSAAFDSSVLKTPLRLSGVQYPKGIGVRSYSSLRFDAAGFESFEALIGLDETAGATGSVRFIVQLDGKKAFESEEITSSSAPKQIRVALNGAKELELIVDYAKRGDLEDYANWCNARLIR